MKTMIAAGLLLLAGLAIAPSADALAPIGSPDIPPQCDLDPSDGFIYCKSPVGHGCVWVDLSDQHRYCTG